jgi:NitT/TauT family transport system substrate-binding protein
MTTETTETTNTTAMRRRTALGLIGGAAASIAAPGYLRQVTAQGLDKISYNTNWRAQAEHGGFYYALANGFYKDAGLDADIRMGGPQLNMNQILVGGIVDIVMSNSFESINFAREGLPFLTIGSLFQKDPQVIISHPGVGHDKLENLKGKTILVGGTGRTSFWPFLKAKYGFTDDQIRPYTFNIQPFVADKQISQQGFLSSEPYAIEKEAGIKPVVHLIADHGFENYNTTFTTSQKLVTEKKSVVQRFVDASLKGWAEYMKGGPGNAAANALIKKANADMGDDKLAHALKVMNDFGIVRSGDALKLGIGAMTDERWQRFYNTMADAGAFPKGIDVKKAYSLEFVNKGIGA